MRPGGLGSVKPIRLFGDPVLRTPAEPVRDFDAELRRLVKDLTETMLDAPGAGPAAPQIGVGQRGFTYHVDDHEPGHLIKPSVALPLDRPRPLAPDKPLAGPVRGRGRGRRALPVVSWSRLPGQAGVGRGCQGL